MTSRRRRAAAGAAGLAVLTAGLLAACGGSGGTSASQPPAGSAATQSPAGSAVSGQHIEITGNDALRFQPMTVRVHTGRVRITLKNMGAYPHNIVIPALKVRSATVTGDPGAGPVSFTVTFGHPGHYPFHCQYHQSAGMTGVFVVS
ncbi:MAG TPA: cupredoxin domain-containing protein [Streptosporangiaceae bacterium]|jgi:plastocyanin